MLGAEVPIRILLVEDDDLEYSKFEQALGKTGLNASLEIAKTAAEALLFLGDQEFDCIFLIINCLMQPVSIC